MYDSNNTEQAKARRVKDLSESLAENLNLRYSDALKDANYNLKYGQYDEFVSNVYASYLRKQIRLGLFNMSRLKRLISLMHLQHEIAELKDYVAKNPESPSDRRARRFL